MLPTAAGMISLKKERVQGRPEAEAAFGWLHHPGRGGAGLGCAAEIGSTGTGTAPGRYHVLAGGRSGAHPEKRGAVVLLRLGQHVRVGQHVCSGQLVWR